MACISHQRLAGRRYAPRPRFWHPLRDQWNFRGTRRLKLRSFERRCGCWMALRRGGSCFRAKRGKVYCISQSGTASVVKAGRDWELLATTPLDEDCFATPTLANGSLYLRTEASVLCFGKRG